MQSEEIINAYNVIKTLKFEIKLEIRKTAPHVCHAFKSLPINWIIMRGENIINLYLFSFKYVSIFL